MGTKLQTLLDSGVIWLDEQTYVGEAWDGVEVQFGQIGEEKTIERYLTLCPNPDCW